MVDSYELTNMDLFLRNVLNWYKWVLVLPHRQFSLVHIWYEHKLVVWSTGTINEISYLWYCADHRTSLITDHWVSSPDWTIVCFHPEDGLRCRLGGKPLLKLKLLGWSTYFRCECSKRSWKSSKILNLIYTERLTLWLCATGRLIKESRVIDQLKTCF